MSNLHSQKNLWRIPDPRAATFKSARSMNFQAICEPIRDHFCQQSKGSRQIALNPPNGTRILILFSKF